MFLSKSPLRSEFDRVLFVRSPLKSNNRNTYALDDNMIHRFLASTNHDKNKFNLLVPNKVNAVNVIEWHRKIGEMV